MFMFIFNFCEIVVFLIICFITLIGLIGMKKTNPIILSKLICFIILILLLILFLFVSYFFIESFFCFEFESYLPLTISGIEEFRLINSNSYNLNYEEFYHRYLFINMNNKEERITFNYFFTYASDFIIFLLDYFDILFNSFKNQFDYIIENITVPFYSNFLNFFNIIKLFFIFLYFLYFIVLFLLKLQYSLVWEYYLIILISLFTILIVISSNNLFIIFLCFELISLCIYILIFSGYFSKKLVNSGLEYFILSALLNLLLLFGISLFYIYYPTLNIYEVQLVFLSGVNIDFFVFFIIFFLFLSFAFKVGLFPFYNWLPFIYDGLPLHLLILLMIPLKILYFVIFIRLLQGPFIFLIYFLSPFFFIFGIFSICVGLLGALGSSSFKKLFSFGSILHTGIIFILLSFFTEDMYIYIYVYLFIYGILLFILLIFCILFISLNDRSFLIDFSLLIENNRILSWWFFINLFSLVGIPPLTGSLLKFALVKGFVDQGFLSGIILILFFLSSGGFYYLKVLKVQKFSDNLLYIKLNLLKSYSFISYFIIFLSLFQFLLFFYKTKFLILYPYFSNIFILFYLLVFN